MIAIARLKLPTLPPCVHYPEAYDGVEAISTPSHKLQLRGAKFSLKLHSVKLMLMNFFLFFIKMHFYTFSALILWGMLLFFAKKINK